MNQDANPYRPPNSDVGAQAGDGLAEPAGKGRRFGTLMIDYLCFVVFGFIVGAAIGLVFGARGVAAMDKIPDLLFGSVLVFTYYIVFEGIWSRTPGKWAFGTVVVNEAGARPSFRQIAGRTACRFIPFEAFSFFGVRGWHDSIPNTRVVRCR